MKSKSKDPELAGIIKRNIDTIANIERAAHEARTPVDRLADNIAKFCGSMHFVWVHCIWFGGWLTINTLPQFKHTLRFDPPPFGVLTLIVSLEAIFLSTFILISQNRQQRLADQRNQLDLQINLLAEQEASQIILMLNQIMEKLGIDFDADTAKALQNETDPAKLAESLESITPEP